MNGTKQKWSTETISSISLERDLFTTNFHSFAAFKTANDGSESEIPTRHSITMLTHTHKS